MTTAPSGRRRPDRRTDPTDRTDRTDHTAPTDRTDRTDRTDHTDQADPAATRRRRRAPTDLAARRAHPAGRHPATRRRRQALTWVLVALAPGLTGPGCGGGGDGNRGDRGDRDTGPGGSERVYVVGPELEKELGNIQDAFAPFEEETGIEVVVTGSTSFEERIGDQVAGGNPPDIALFPQPGLLLDLADDIVPVPDDLARRMAEDFDVPGRLDLVERESDGALLGVPVSADLKSLVWYSPEAFDLGGYDVPTTLDELEDLAARMAAVGRTPFCLGLESGVATGWPLTDWFEDYLLRLAGPEVYDAWARHTIPFDDPRVVAVAERVVGLLSRPGYVHEGLEASAERSASRVGRPVLEPNGCMMYRMAHFQGRHWPPGTEVGPDGDVDAFYLPGVTIRDRPALTGGIYAAAFADRHAVRATLEFIADVRFGRERAANGQGFLSPHHGVRPRDHVDSPIDQRAAGILADADPVRYDASDLMPGGIGADALWDAAVAITRGDVTVARAFADIERRWADLEAAGTATAAATTPATPTATTTATATTTTPP